MLQLLLVIGLTVKVEKTQWVKVMEKQGFRQELHFIPNLCIYHFTLKHQTSFTTSQ
jgi:hypothetical protein